MDIRDFKAEEIYQLGGEINQLLSKISLQDPQRMVIGEQTSVPQLLHDYIAAQTHTNNQLMGYVARNITRPNTVEGREISVAEQQQGLVLIAEKQNLLARQIERKLFQHVQEQIGNEVITPQDLINTPPSSYGTESKVSDSGLRLITIFTGDSTNNEEDLTIFLREVYALSATSNLTEHASISVIIRKVSGSAQILLDDYILKKGGHNNVTMAQVVALLEKKFIVMLSPLHSDAQLHNLQINDMSYSQLQAKISKLAKLACRKEPVEKQETLVRVKEISSFLMAISPSDRQVINNENSRRATNNLTPLSLDMMVDYLQNRVVDQLNNDRIYEIRQSKPRDKQVIKKGNKPQGLNKAKKFVTFQMANVAQNACLLCGNESHKFTAKECPYFGQDLMTSPCRKCNIGAHATRVCKNK